MKNCILSINLEDPIDFKYPKPSKSFIESLKKGNECVELREKPGILLANSYYKQGIKGALDKMFVRARVSRALEDALSFLPKEYGFIVFDAYRSKTTQKSLFESFSKQIAANHPHMSTEQLYAETRKFVAHPDESSRFRVPPHNSGGAIDLGLTIKDHPLEMGTSFDDLTSKAATNFFEEPYAPSSGLQETQWAEARKNRRILFNCMREAGFTNWKYEWWHFDMGNSLWSQELGLPWIYDSMNL